MSLVAPFPAGRNAALSARHGRPSSGSPGRRTRISPGTTSPALLRVVPDPTPTIQPSSVRRPSLRLTRRGHVVLFAVSCLALFGIVLGSGAVADASVEGGAAPVTATVVVAQGDSLWSIARSLSNDQDPREMVQRIRELNGIGDWPIVPGQRLVVPTVPEHS